MSPNTPTPRPFAKAAVSSTVRVALFTLCAVLFTPARPARADVGFALPPRATVQMPLAYKTDAAGQVVLDANGWPVAGPPTLFVIDTSVAACGPTGNGLCDVAAWQKRYGPGRATSADKFSPGERGGTLKAALGALCEAAKTSGPISLAGPRGLAKVGGSGDCKATQIETADAWFGGYFQAALDAANRLDLPDPTCEPTVCPDPPACPICAIGCPMPPDLLAIAHAYLDKCDAGARCDWRAVRLSQAIVTAANACTDRQPPPVRRLISSIDQEPVSEPEDFAGALGGQLGHTMLQMLLRAACASVIQP